MRAVFGRAHGQPPVKVNVRHHGNRRTRRDGQKRLCRLHVRHGHANDLAALRRKTRNLCTGLLHIRSARVAHRLHRDFRPAADGDIAYKNLSFRRHGTCVPLSMHRPAGHCRTKPFFCPRPFFTPRATKRRADVSRRAAKARTHGKSDDWCSRPFSSAQILSDASRRAVQKRTDAQQIGQLAFPPFALYKSCRMCSAAPRKRGRTANQTIGVPALFPLRKSCRMCPAAPSKKERTHGESGDWRSRLLPCASPVGCVPPRRKSTACAAKRAVASPVFFLRRSC